MSAKTCCRNCQYCVGGNESSGAWCRLRKMRVHPEIEFLAFCSHWTQRPPSLPKLEDKTSSVSVDDMQLEFERELVVSIDA